MAKTVDKTTQTRAASVIPQEKTQAVAERVGTGALAIGADVDGAWGGEDISNTDIIIPKILLMQPMSELVTDGIAKIGEFRDSLNTARVLGDEKAPVEVVVFGTFRTWMTFKDGEYLNTIARDASNEALPREEIEEGSGAAITRTQILNAYCLMPKDIASGEAFPFVLSFKSTSYTAGKALMTHIKKLQMFKKPSAAKVFLVSCHKETNDKGTFFVPDIAVLRDSTEAEMAQAYEWYKLIARSKVKVDDSDMTKNTTETPSSSTTARKDVGPEKTVQV